MSAPPSTGRPTTRTHPARRYLWWPLVLSAAWLGAVAVGLPWPAVTLLAPCVLAVALVRLRGPFRRATLPQTLRMTTALVPMIVVSARNPWYDRYGYSRGIPDVITTTEFWAHVARAEIVALLVVEVALLALAARTDER